MNVFSDFCSLNEFDLKVVYNNIETCKMPNNKMRMILTYFLQIGGGAVCLLHKRFDEFRLLLE